VLIIGGGAAGMTSASHYARKLPNSQVAVIEVRQAIVASGTAAPALVTGSHSV
jgi:NADH dehydrogenase FAD-containing subunit